MAETDHEASPHIFHGIIVILVLPIARSHCIPVILFEIGQLLLHHSLPFECPFLQFWSA